MFFVTVLRFCGVSRISGIHCKIDFTNKKRRMGRLNGVPRHRMVGYFFKVLRQSRELNVGGSNLLVCFLSLEFINAPAKLTHPRRFNHLDLLCSHLFSPFFFSLLFYE